MNIHLHLQTMNMNPNSNSTKWIWNSKMDQKHAYDCRTTVRNKASGWIYENGAPLTFKFRPKAWNHQGSNSCNENQILMKLKLWRLNQEAEKLKKLKIWIDTSRGWKEPSNKIKIFKKHQAGQKPHNKTFKSLKINHFEFLNTSLEQLKDFTNTQGRRWNQSKEARNL